MIGKARATARAFVAGFSPKLETFWASVDRRPGSSAAALSGSGLGAGPDAGADGPGELEAFLDQGQCVPDLSLALPNLVMGRVR
jgi:hypothetical protein